MNGHSIEQENSSNNISLPPLQAAIQPHSSKNQRPPERSRHPNLSDGRTFNSQPSNMLVSELDPPRIITSNPNRFEREHEC